jgi:hypothetical protein
MSRSLLLTLLLAMLLAACGAAPPASPTIAPSASPLPATVTWTPLRPFETATSSPVPELLTPTLELPSLTVEPSLTASPAPLLPTGLPTQQSTALPQPAADSGAIQILTPGPISTVVSPIQLRAYVIPGFNGRVRIELFGEDGRLLDRTIVNLGVYQTWTYLYHEITFEVHAAGELGRLSVSTQDSNGRTTALYSVHVLLLSAGSSQISPPGNLKERVVVDKPGSNQTGAGGLLHVAGSMRPLDSLPIVVELVTADNASLSARLVTIPAAADDSYVPFSIDVPYSLSGARSALLVVRQADDRIPGAMYLYSQPVTLYP